MGPVSVLKHQKVGTLLLLQFSQVVPSVPRPVSEDQSAWIIFYVGL